MQERLLLLLLLLHSSTVNTQLVQVSEMIREHKQTDSSTAEYSQQIGSNR